MSLNRPTSEETEDDLLRFQEEFLASGIQPAVKVVKKRKSNNTPSQNKSAALEECDADHDVVEMDVETRLPKKVRFEPKVTVEHHPMQEDDVEKEMDARDTHITAILTKIEERDTQHIPVLFPSLRTSAFPSVFQRSKKQTSAVELKERKSIFAQQFERKSLKDYGIPPNVDNGSAQILQPCPLKPLPDIIPMDHLKGLFPAPKIVSGSGLSSRPETSQFSVEESKKIHEENLQKISTMSESEILSEKQKLMSELDPNLVQFLRARSKTNKPKESPSAGMESSSNQEGKGAEVMDTEDFATDKNRTTEYSQNDPLEGKYLHMDKVEPEKLAWTEMIPKTRKKEINLQHRFDFDGNVLSGDVDVPSHLGLHHHGVDPELPGYTLQELFILSRSNFTQQRVFAMSMLGKIIAKAKLGNYLEVISEPILKTLLQSGLLFLLRWSLDDQSETLLQASVFALHSLLASTQTKAMLEFTFISDRGCEFPSLSPLVNFKNDDGDFEIAEKDVIAGLLKMSILPRIRYILEVCKPSAVTVNQCLDILIRISRHSLQSALKIYECPRLVKYIVNKLISVPSDTQASGDQTRSLHSPFPKAIALLRSICSAGRNVTSRLLNEYKDLKATVIFKYISLSDDECGEQVKTDVILEAWRFWILCMSYGFFSETFRELFPIITGLIQSLTTFLSASEDTSIGDLMIKRGQLIFKLCSTALANSSDETMNQWKELRDQTQLVASTISQILKETDEIKNTREFCLLLTASLDFLSKYCEESSRKSDVLEKASFSESLCDNTLPLIFENLKLLSLSRELQFLRVEKLPSLPELITISGADALIYFQILRAYLRCSVAVCCLNKSLCVRFVSTIVYLAKSCSWMLSSAENITAFTLRCRTYCLYWAVNLYSLITSVIPTLEPEISHHSTFFYFVAFGCFGLLGNGDEHMMHNLLSSVLFNPALIRAVMDSTSSVTQGLESLDVSNSLSELMPDATEITDSLLSSLPSVRSTYMSSLAVSPKILLESKQRFLHLNSEVASYILKHNAEEPAAPSDWPFIPLLQLYDQGIRGDLPGGSLTHISNSLHYLCFLERHCKYCLTSVPTTAKIVRLMCVFLAGNDVFLELPVKRCLSFLFSHYCNVKSQQELDFSQSIPGISSFYDFYLSLLEQYEGVSYGDELFSAVVLLPLHQLNGGISELKKAVWSDRKEILRILSLPISKLLVPIRYYLYPVETDVFLRREYLLAIASGCCTQTRCPALYQIATHHLAEFLFNKELDVDVSSRKEIYRGVMKIRDPAVRGHILQYENNERRSSE